MSTKEKAVAKKATPAKGAPKAKPTETTPAVELEIAVMVLKKGSSPSLSDTGVLDYKAGAESSGASSEIQKNENGKQTNDAIKRTHIS